MAGRLLRLQAGIGGLVRAIQDDDEAAIDRIARLSRSRRLFAPLAFAVGAFAMLFEGLRLLVTNWRLTLIQVLPALWIWLVMYDLKAHVLHGKSYNALRGPVLIPLGLAVVAVTVAGFFLNGVFGFAIAGSRPPAIRPAFARARRNIAPIVVTGGVVGVLLAVATLVAPRWGSPWFALLLGAVVAVMMISYVAVPARLIGIKSNQPRRDKLTASAVVAALSVTVCTPPYMLGRLGILMLGSKVLLIPGIFLLAFGFTLHAGATGAVRAIKLGAALAAPGAARAAAGDGA